MSVLLSEFIPTFPSLLCPQSILYIWFLCPPYKEVHQSHFSRFLVHVLIYDICFSLYDLTSLCLKQIPGLSTSLQKTWERLRAAGEGDDRG